MKLRAYYRASGKSNHTHTVRRSILEGLEKDPNALSAFSLGMLDRSSEI